MGLVSPPVFILPRGICILYKLYVILSVGLHDLITNGQKQKWNRSVNLQKKNKQIDTELNVE